MLVAAVTPENALVSLAVGTAGLCAASLAAVVAVQGRLGSSPGWRAVLFWLPIAAAVIAARSVGQADIALGIIFGTSIALLSTAVGSLCAIAPVGPAPARWKRLWPFTGVAGLLVFVSGFNGLLNWRHGVALGLEGLMILSLWRDEGSEPDWGASPPNPSEPMIPTGIVWMAAVVSLALAGFGAWLAVRGSMEMTHRSVHVSPLAVGASLLSLILVTPMVQSGRRLAIAGKTWIPMTAQIGMVLLNLCLLLPIIAFTPYLSSIYQAMDFHHRPVIRWDEFSPALTVFPLVVWRIDAVVLTLLSILLLPVAFGKWNLGRVEGLLLIGGYCVYLLSVTVAGMG